ncbi:MAG: glycosyltransferase family 2 protein [Lachnospiraceae bacterium]|nr:glycosyltransferase family 2 protein [Lachnospiraceae bacterium]
MENQKPAVAVLLSTYNGERFLKEQLESVFSQTGVKVHLFLRDDGSSDKTLEIAEEYKETYNDSVTVIKGGNVGVGCSFMELVYSAGDDFDYYAFCDQDDIWLDGKLITAAEIIRKEEKDSPVLYCSNQMLIDADGNETGLRHKEFVENSYLQILNCNKATGCTMVWNRSLQRLLSEEQRRPAPEILKKRIHDVWVAMVAAVTGKIIYDENAYILYRQHGGNVVGSKGTNVFVNWKSKISDPSLRNGRSALAAEILKNYSDVIPDESVKDTLRNYSEYKTNKERRRILLKKGDIPKYSGEGNASVKIKIRLRLL